MNDGVIRPEIRRQIKQMTDAESEAFLNYLFEKKKEKTVQDYLIDAFIEWEKDRKLKIVKK